MSEPRKKSDLKKSEVRSNNAQESSSEVDDASDRLPSDGSNAEDDIETDERFASEEESEETEGQDNDQMIHSQEEDEDEDMQDFDHTRRDANERELEKLVFGDGEGFRSALQDFEAARAEDAPEDPVLRPVQDGVTAVPDEDLFFIDDKPAENLRPGHVDLLNVSDDDEDVQRDKPAWEDSDDEKMQISLMSVPRLRKLRNFEGEDIISGTEYQKRLRRQYRMLHPPPKWAQWRPAREPEERPRKRRKVLGEDANGSNTQDSSDADGDVSMDDAEMETAPSLVQLLKSSRPLLRKNPTMLSRHSGRPRLKPEVIDIDRLRDIVATSSPQPHSTTTLSLHPTLPLLITSGLSGMLFMHHIRPFPTPPDPANPLVTSLSMKNTQMSTACFSPLAGTHDEPKIYLAAGRRAFHTWTLPTGNISKTTRIGGQQQGDIQQRVRIIKPSPCGRWIGIQGSAKKGGGTVNILSASSLQWVAQARGEGRGGLADFCWWSDGEGMSLVGKLGEVAEWSVEERRIILRWQDQGGVGITVMAMGVDPDGVIRTGKTQKHKSGWLGPDRWSVLGTNTGFATIYDRAALAKKSQENMTNGTNGAEVVDDARPPIITPTPHATLSHLTTPISHLAISPCGQILGMASKWKRDAIRLVHLSSGIVYRNWPTARTPLGRISSMTLGECEGIVQGSKDEEGRGTILIVGNEQGIVRNWVIRG